MNSVIIDNCIVSKFMENGVRIMPIRLKQKLNPNFNIHSLQKITYGNKSADNRILCNLSNGILKFEDLFENNSAF